jgi:hypothetical protein
LKKKKRIAAITMKLMMLSGSSFDQPSFITWLYLNLGMVQRTQINRKTKNAVFAVNTVTSRIPFARGESSGSQ